MKNLNGASVFVVVCRCHITGLQTPTSFCGCGIISTREWWVNVRAKMFSCSECFSTFCNIFSNLYLSSDFHTEIGVKILLYVRRRDELLNISYTHNFLLFLCYKWRELVKELIYEKKRENKLHAKLMQPMNLFLLLRIRRNNVHLMCTRTFAVFSPHVLYQGFTR